MATALFIHHDANSHAGLLGDAAARAGFDVVDHFICDELASGIASRPFPSLDGVDLLVLLGSRWSVYDRDNVGTWIDDEIALIRAARDRDLPLLGVCFGGQVLAEALGGSVGPGPFPEIGWLDITVDDTAPGEAERFAIGTGPWLQWHLDVFTPPPGSTLLASSPAGPQAFAVGRMLGLQFHPEVDRRVLEAWLRCDRDQLEGAGVDPDALLGRTDEETPAATRRCDAFFDAFLAATRLR